MTRYRSPKEIAAESAARWKYELMKVMSRCPLTDPVMPESPSRAVMKLLGELLPTMTAEEQLAVWTAIRRTLLEEAPE